MTTKKRSKKGTVSKRTQQMNPIQIIAIAVIVVVVASIIWILVPKTGSGISSTPVSVLTPASLDAIIGNTEPIIAVDNNWLSYQDNELGIALNYPPNWQAITLNNASGVGLYPPESDPNLLTPMIKIEWFNVPYSSKHPLVKTESSINSIEVSGVIGRQYEDTKFAIPTQSYYIELPYRYGTLFFSATEGPSVNLTSQLNEILKTFTFLN